MSKWIIGGPSPFAPGEMDYDDPEPMDMPGPEYDYHISIDDDDEVDIRYHPDPEIPRGIHKIVDVFPQPEEGPPAPYQLPGVSTGAPPSTTEDGGSFFKFPWETPDGEGFNLNWGSLFGTSETGFTPNLNMTTLLILMMLMKRR